MKSLPQTEVAIIMNKRFHFQEITACQDVALKRRQGIKLHLYHKCSRNADKLASLGHIQVALGKEISYPNYIAILFESYFPRYLLLKLTSPQAMHFPPSWAIQLIGFVSTQVGWSCEGERVHPVEYLTGG